MKQRARKRPPVGGAGTRHKSKVDPARSDSTPGDAHANTDVAHLSQREREIVGLLIDGRSVKEASAALGLSPRTVEGYLERLKQRFHQPRLLALVVHLVKQGLLITYLLNRG
jgi:DNA-binding CsgD family transcriptional regulator